MTDLFASQILVARGDRRILGEIDFRASAGEFVALIGPNGAGKSTLLSVLAGLLNPDAGSVTLNNRALANYGSTELARIRAYLPQNPRCEWAISVERLVALGLTPSLPAIGRMPADYQSKIEAALADSDLLGQRNQQATTLSGGELARAMQARALVGDPQILIVDEPIAGLDPLHAMDSIRRLRQLASSGKLVIASIHDLTLAARYTTRVCALHGGRVAADGPTQETLTAELLHDIFEVEGRVSGAGETAFVDYLAPS